MKARFHRYGSISRSRASTSATSVNLSMELASNGVILVLKSKIDSNTSRSLGSMTGAPSDPVVATPTTAAASSSPALPPLSEPRRSTNGTNGLCRSVEHGFPGRCKPHFCIAATMWVFTWDGRQDTATA